MKTEHQEIVLNHIQQLGFEDIFSFALEQLINTNENELKASRATIKSFEEKYQMDYTAFDKSFHSINHIGMFEKEDDGMDWEMEIEYMKATERVLSTLKTLKEDDDKEML